MADKLIVDIGNTRTKLALFHNDLLTDLRVFEKPDTGFIEQMLEKYPDVQGCILSAVRVYPREIDELLKRQGFFIQLNKSTPLPFQNKYKTPGTLGKDRLAIAAGAQAQFPEQNVLTIVAGTTVTYDFINCDGEYLGGNISPGLHMRLKALHTFTDQLPLIELMDSDIELIGTTTETAILSGALHGMAAEMEGMIHRYQNKYKSLKIIFGGGDYKYFDKRLKNNIFATPNIVLKGLKEILDFNEEI
ncbi:MAG: type III pantothenate kinase [Bacteroidales bacterium]|nr:type III pantothenate kinase [Bacteroidales bacterium]